MIFECILNIVCLVKHQKFLREKRIRLASDSILYRVNKFNINLNKSPVPAQLSTTQQRSFIMNQAKHSIMMVTCLCLISVLNHLVLLIVVVCFNLFGQILVIYYAFIVSFFLLSSKHVLDFFVFIFLNRNFKRVCLKYLCKKNHDV